MVISDAINSKKADYNEYDDSISDKSENYNPVGPIFLKRHMLSLHSSSHLEPILDSPPSDLEAFCLRKRVKLIETKNISGLVNNEFVFELYISIYFKEPRIVGLDTDQGSATIQNAVIAGVIAAMLICIVGILFVVHRIKKKDEGSYKISASPS